MAYPNNPGSNDLQQQHNKARTGTEENTIDGACADLSLFWLQLTQNFCSGRQLLQSLRDIQTQLAGKPLAAVVECICDDIQQGQSLSLAMQRHPHIFGKHVLCLVEGGERAGILDRVLLLVLEYSWRCPQCIMSPAKSARGEMDDASSNSA